MFTKPNPFNYQSLKNLAVLVKSVPELEQKTGEVVFLEDIDYDKQEATIKGQKVPFEALRNVTYSIDIKKLLYEAIYSIDMPESVLKKLETFFEQVTDLVQEKIDDAYEQGQEDSEQNADFDDLANDESSETILEYLLNRETPKIICEMMGVKYSTENLATKLESNFDANFLERIIVSGLKHELSSLKSNSVQANRIKKFISIYA